MDQKPPCVIFDVDGTLCDVRTVRHFVDGSSRRRDFKSFHKASSRCPAFPKVRSLLSDFKKNGFAIIVVTGRETRWQELTVNWLKNNQISFDLIIMRNDKDYRPDPTIKSEIQELVARDFSPVLAVDDRDSIIAVWQSAGIATLKVAEPGSLERIRWPDIRKAGADDLGIEEKIHEIAEPYFGLNNGKKYGFV